jgi:hypothetical protein
MSRGRGRAPRLVTLAEIRGRFQLAPTGRSPAVGRRTSNTDGRHLGWYVRVVVVVSVTHERVDTFQIDRDGTILGAPWGFAKDYRPGRMDPAELEAASRPTEATEPAR